MQEQAPSEIRSVEAARTAVVRWSLRSAAIGGLLWWVSAAVGSRSFSSSPYGLGGLALLVLIWLAMLPGIGAGWRLCAILVFSFVLNLLAMAYVGLSPGNTVLIILSVLIVSLYWGIPAGLVAGAAIVLMIAAAAYGWHRGLLPLQGFSSSLDFTHMSNWVRTGIATMVGALATALIIDVSFRRLRAAVTELSATMARLQESETRYRVLFEEAGDHTLVLELRDNALPVIVDANEAALRAHGYQRAELVGQPVSVIEPGISLDQSLERRCELEKSESRLFDVRHRRKDGTWIDVEVQNRLVNIGGKKVVISVERDVTERKRAEQQLAMLKYSIDAHYDGAYWIDSDSRFVYVNGAGCKALGYTREEIIGRRVTDFDPRATPDKLEQFWTLLRRDGFYSRESVHRRRDGTEFPVEIVMTHVQFGGCEYACGFAHDITKRRKAEDALRESERHYQILFERMLDGYALHEIILDGAGEPVDYRYLAVNPAFERLTGLSAGEVVGRLVSEVMPDSDLSRIRIYSEVARTGEPRRFESPAPRMGRYFEVLAFRTEPGRVACVFQDIADRKRLEAQLVYSQKMEAVGQLAGGVAHDFNNILAASLMNLGLLQLDPTVTPEVKAILAELEAGAHRAANLTRQLLMFSRRQVLQVRHVDLDRILANILQMLRRLIGEDIRLEFTPASAPRWIEADAGMIEQVITNLCINARDAMPLGGTLTLATREAEIDERQARTNTETEPGRYVVLTVTDTGCGMDDATIKRIFEPFFTTKEVGKGTGLGLATVYGIVKQHQGWIEVRSTVGKGSTFEVYLPAGTEPGEQEPGEAARPVAGGHETILIVEDEAPVRQTLRACLRLYGYRVLEAETGVQALEIWQRQNGRIDLLFTDMIMPEGMTGLQLAERLWEEAPALKVIVSSGYHAKTARSFDGRPDRIHYLAKPFEVPTLAATVRDFLDGKE